MTTHLQQLTAVVPRGCDRCGARAYIRAILSSGGELLFCGHHARKHSGRLRELRAQIQQA